MKFKNLKKESHENASLFLLGKWKEQMEEGMELKGRKSFSPDNVSFPDLKSTSFRAENLEAMAGNEQREVISYLLQGFREGFKITDNIEIEPVFFPNIEINSQRLRKQ